jgi:hypothetical protein
METHVIRWSYWLGIASFAIALVWRAVNTFGLFLPKPGFMQGETIYYMSFYKAGFLFLLVAIATANYSWFNSRKTQP